VDVLILRRFVLILCAGAWLASTSVRAEPAEIETDTANAGETETADDDEPEAADTGDAEPEAEPELSGEPEIEPVVELEIDTEIDTTIRGLKSASLPAEVASGEEPPEPQRPRTRIYEAEHFARFSPRTALDMLRQVPGFVIREAQQERGLGQATGNVLLNGQRISGKSEDIIAQLSRLPAQNVQRIVIVDGATLDIPGLSGQVANVVSRARAVSGRYAWSPEFRLEHTDPLLTRFDASASGERGPVEFTLGVANRAYRGGAGGPTYIETDSGELIERRDDVWNANGEDPTLSGRFAFAGPAGSTGNLNLSGRRLVATYHEEGYRTGTPNVDRHRTVTNTQRHRAYEAGGDYELALGPGRLKLIGIHRAGRGPVESEVITRFEDGSPDQGNRFSRLGQESESIGRTEYRFRAGGGDMQLSAESAFNRLDSDSQLFVLEEDGSFAEIPLPGGTARVAENRYEVMASHGRSLADNLKIQLAAGGEYSRLSQVGGGGLSRGFWRPKGIASAAWQPRPGFDVNIGIQRRVAQLNFFDFLAQVNLGDNLENAGNPELVPPQSWEGDVETVRGLGSWGTTALRLYGHVIDDIIDIIPIGETGESPGNAGRAYRYGVESKNTAQLDPIGWRGAKLDARVQLQQSRLDDPLTGEPRQISNSLKRLVELALRHDVNDWVWGKHVTYRWAAPTVRLTEVGRLYEGPLWASLFVEHKDVFGLTARVTAANLLYGKSLWDRTVYDGRRTDSAVAFIENRQRTIGPIFVMTMSGAF
jgi:outer membrane receptor for ferrienterochelin and colicins